MSSNHRELFIPKLPERQEQCASCPFREGNDAQFSVIVAGIVLHETGVALGPAELEVATSTTRRNIGDQVSRLGEFHCHLTAYTSDMSVRPEREHRQCPGATEFYINAWEPQ